MKRWMIGCALAMGMFAAPAMAQEEEGSVFGPEAGDWEFTLGGGGSNDHDFNNGGFQLNGSLGYFFTEEVEVVLRQGVSFADVDGDSEAAGSTFMALDYHFDLGRLRPFVGVNAGAIYNEDDCTFGAGLEGGLKFYVKPKTFIFGIMAYEWTFDDSDDAEDNFEDGSFVYSVGIGFNF